MLKKYKFANRKLLYLLLVALLALIYLISNFQAFNTEEIEEFGYTPEYINIVDTTLKTGHYSSSLTHLDNENSEKIINEVQREPLYPLVLLLSKSIANNFTITLQLQLVALFITIYIWLLFIIKRFGIYVTTVFYLLLFFNPTLYFFSAVLYPYIFQMLFLSLATISLIYAIEKNKISWYLITGIMITLGTYERGTLIALPFFITVCLIPFLRRFKIKASYLILIFIVPILLLLPWLIRNFKQEVGGVNQMLGYTLGYTYGNLAITQYSKSVDEKTYNDLVFAYGTDKASLIFIDSLIGNKNISYATADKTLTNIVLRKIISDPKSALKIVVNNIINYPSNLFRFRELSTNKIYEYYQTNINVSGQIIDYVIILLAFFGGAMLYKRNNTILLVFIILLVYNFLYTTTTVIFDERYRGIIDILLYTLCAVSIINIIKYIYNMIKINLSAKISRNIK